MKAQKAEVIIMDLSQWFEDYRKDMPDLFLVGGGVRDILLHRPPKDFDLVCKDAKAFATAFADSLNLALVPMEKKPDEPTYRLVNRQPPHQSLDIAEMRGKTIVEDLLCRDFTINAMAMPIDQDGRMASLLDPTRGQRDLDGKIIRQTGPGVFAADPLRILRAFRFAAQLGFEIDSETHHNARRSVCRLAQVATERITTELMLLLNTEEAFGQVCRMDDMKILEQLIPEIRHMKGCSQNFYHHKDVWGHSLLALKNLEHILKNLEVFFGATSDVIDANLKKHRRRPLLKMAVLLHDVGKPPARQRDEDTGRITFYGHDRIGAEMVVEIARRLKFSGKDVDFLSLMVSEHLHVLDLSAPEVTQRTQMKWFRKLKADVIPAVILGLADRQGTCGPESRPEAIQAHADWSRTALEAYIKAAENVLGQKSLISGKDLIALGMTPGREIGRLLSRIREAQDLGEIRNRVEALELAKVLVGAGAEPPIS